MRLQSQEYFLGSRLSQLPPTWAKRITRVHSEIASCYVHEINAINPEFAALRAANLALLDVTDRLNASSTPLDASDDCICLLAVQRAKACSEYARIAGSYDTQHALMVDFVGRFGLLSPNKKISTLGSIRRMEDAIWWRRGLRSQHAAHVEQSAITLGYVSRQSEIYVSDESVRRRRAQNARNTRTLAQTNMVSDTGQCATLADLASTGVGNKSIRRAELMTRISGFELIARDLHHDGIFLTLTCPSRMHRYLSVAKDRVVKNSKYDETTPRDAQRYLSVLYARVRAQLARHDIGIYGFRIAEPHHDGCPHWHLLLFCEPAHSESVISIFRSHALRDSPDESGAADHRLTSIRIDWSRGTAAGYIAKYVSKNIDGLHIESDLYGNPSMETSQRVEAWATTWRIRQFQQVGGPPVGVWRELRRIESLPASASQALRDAHAAVNRTGDDDDLHRASWAEYCIAQGGVFCGRKNLIRLEKRASVELGRYGDEIPPRPIGVSVTETVLDWFGMIPNWPTLVTHVYESVRHVWRRAGGGRSFLLPQRSCGSLGLV